MQTLLQVREPAGLQARQALLIHFERIECSTHWSYRRRQRLLHAFRRCASQHRDVFLELAESIPFNESALRAGIYEALAEEADAWEPFFLHELTRLFEALTCFRRLERQRGKNVAIQTRMRLLVEIKRLFKFSILGCRRPGQHCFARRWRSAVTERSVGRCVTAMIGDPGVRALHLADGTRLPLDDWRYRPVRDRGPAACTMGTDGVEGSGRARGRAGPAGLRNEQRVPWLIARVRSSLTQATRDVGAKPLHRSRASAQRPSEG